MDKRRDHARVLATFDLSQVDALVSVYREALDELRSWRDPGVAGLIGRLESLQLQAAGQRRYLIEGTRTALHL